MNFVPDRPWEETLAKRDAGRVGTKTSRGWGGLLGDWVLWVPPAEGIGSFPLSSGGDQKPPLCPRTIKEKRDAYVRRLNEIYENNLKKVRTSR